MRKTENKMTEYLQWASGVIAMRDGYRKAAWEQFVACDFLATENLFGQWRTQAKRKVPEFTREGSATSKIFITIGVARPMGGGIVKADVEEWRQFCIKVASEPRELSDEQKAFVGKFSIMAERKRAAKRNKPVTVAVSAASHDMQPVETVSAPRLQTIETDLRAYPAWMLDKPCGRTSLREVLSLLEIKYGADIPQEVVTRLKPQIEALSRQGA